MAFVTNIEKDTLNNIDYRQVIYTDSQIQIVLMTLYPGEDIPLEKHRGSQFIRVEKGNAHIMVGANGYDLSDGMVIVVPAEMAHYVKNKGIDPLQLYTIYSPPEHEEDEVVERQE
jgi:mannose-6-phosphate isomerase-like protein (cupin superfamily)